MARRERRRRERERYLRQKDLAKREEEEALSVSDSTVAPAA